jgi:solute carrier family 41
MRTVDELFILIPMLNNLKGNLELVLSARLGTASHIGVLDRRGSRRALVGGSLALLQLQALCVSALAAIVSFLLGLALPDTDVSSGSTGGGGEVEGVPGRRWLGSGKVVSLLIRRAALKAPKIAEPDRTRSGWRESVLLLHTSSS